MAQIIIDYEEYKQLLSDKQLIEDLKRDISLNKKIQYYNLNNFLNTICDNEYSRDFKIIGYKGDK